MSITSCDSDLLVWSNSCISCSAKPVKASGLVRGIECMSSAGLMILPDTETVNSEHTRIFVGCAIITCNLFLFLFLNSRASMRQKYIFFTLVSLGDILDGGYLVYASINRLRDMTLGVYYRETNIWECTLKFNMVFRIFGPELVATTMLVMSSEKLFAVASPIQYRVYATVRNRYLVGLVCIILCLISLAAMFITSYFSPRDDTQADQYCGVSGSVTEPYSLFHQYYQIVCQVLAFFGSSAAYLIAKVMTKKANVKELQSIQPIVVISFISCILLSSSSIVYILLNFTHMNITKATQNIVVTFANAAFQCLKFALYMLTGKEFREAFARMITESSVQMTNNPQTQLFNMKKKTMAS